MQFRFRFIIFFNRSFEWSGIPPGGAVVVFYRPLVSLRRVVYIDRCNDIISAITPAYEYFKMKVLNPHLVVLTKLLLFRTSEIVQVNYLNTTYTIGSTLEKLS